jgi:glycine/D-amino acid oxidase-like deaminating enzyme
MINGDVGYMSAYLEELKEPPTALAYYDGGWDQDNADPYPTDLYFYMTRRPYEHEHGEVHNLVCIGGPEIVIGETEGYERADPFSPEMGERISQFARKTLRKGKEKELKYQYQWHGLMCYTPTKMRVIGAEPKNDVLLYNLGCNGVGILPSVFGGWKIGKILAGEKFDPSIFDPRG